MDQFSMKWCLSYNYFVTEDNMYTFKPYYELDGIPNIIVDGTPHKDSKLILSHWIDSGTPAEWMRDTSAEIVLDYIEKYELPDDAKFVSNDHFDQDGLVGILGVVSPEMALKNKKILIDIATAGDFGKYSNRNAARISMALNSLTKPQYSHFSQEVFKRPYPEMAATFYQETLKLLPQMMSDVTPFSYLWKDEDEFLDYSEGLIKSGTVIIEEDLKSDVAIVIIPEKIVTNKFHRFAVDKMGAIHDMAIHNNTERARILYVHGKKINFKYRYETWVQLKNNTHPLRVDLMELSKKLSEIDSNDWTYSGSDKLVPELKIIADKDSSLNYEKILELIITEFQSQPTNWNPYRINRSS